MKSSNPSALTRSVLSSYNIGGHIDFGVKQVGISITHLSQLRLASFTGSNGGEYKFSLKKKKKKQLQIFKNSTNMP